VPPIAAIVAHVTPILAPIAAIRASIAHVLGAIADAVAAGFSRRRRCHDAHRHR
jgi:hypothetical protein